VVVSILCVDNNGGGALSGEMDERNTGEQRGEGKKKSLKTRKKMQPEVATATQKRQKEG